jgi:hypothetical protein
MRSTNSVAPRRFRCTSAERVMAFVHDAIDHDGIVTAAAEIHSALDPQRLEQALLLMQQRHAKLRAELTPAASQWPSFLVHESAAPIPVTWVSATDPVAWEDFAIAGASTPFPAGTVPLMRMMIVTNAVSGKTHLIGWFHHAALDGVSAWSFFQELLLLYADPAAAPLVDGEASFSVPLPGPKWKFGDRWWIFQQVFNQVWQNRKKKPAMTPVDSQPPGAITQWWWPVDRTAALLQRCKAEDVTVFQAISAAALLAVTDHYGWWGRNVGCQAPINLRNRMEPQVSPKSLGMFVASTRVLMSMPEEPGVETLWSLARRFRTDWTNQLKQHDPIDGLRNLQRVRLFRGLMTGRPAAITVNNLGMLTELENHGQPVIEDFVWFGRSQFTGPLCTVHAMTLRGRLKLNLRSEWLAKSTLVALQQQVEAALTTAVEQPLLRVVHAESA